jgi:uncharacterized membrane protein
MMTPERLLSAAHFSMAISLVVSLGVIYLVYISEVELSIPLLVGLHICLIIFPAVFKVAYVARLTALKQLGRSAD